MLGSHMVILRHTAKPRIVEHRAMENGGWEVRYGE